MAEVPAARVLVVDDEPQNRDLLRRILDREFLVAEAEEGEIALAALEVEPADVVIADFAMPRMTGATLLAEINARWPRTVGLLLTGYDDDDQVLAARSAGHAFAILAKPWTLRAVQELVRAAASEAARRRGS